MASKLFQWWTKRGHFYFDPHNVLNLPPTPNPVLDISHAGDPEGLLTLYGQVMKKSLFACQGRATAILRMPDRTLTPHCFRDVCCSLTMTQNPNEEVDSNKIVFDNVHCINAVNILVICSSSYTPLSWRICRRVMQ